MDIDEATMQTVRTVLAQQLLKSVSEEHRDAILTKSITDALKEWSFRSAIQGVIAEEAQRVVADMLQQKAWQDEIRDTLEEGFADFIKKLHQALPEALQEIFFGKDGTSYDRQPGRILEHLRRVK